MVLKRNFPLRLRLVAPVTAILLSAQAALGAQTDPSQLCEAAAVRAADATGVPLSVLRAIALAESGRSSDHGIRPWPWAVNFSGQGHWYATSDDAQLAVAERQEMGATNFDLGCFQLNYRWHGSAFPSISAMLEPESNALYAARFLQDLFDETGSWSDAAAAYHSRTPEYAEGYRARFEGLLDAASEGGALVSVSAPRENRFPLLQAGSGGALGSLVPRRDGGISLIGAEP